MDWKMPFLSLGGRITLIQSCLSTSVTIFLSLFKILVLVVFKIEKLQRGFLWSRVGEGKIDHLISLGLVRKLKEYGGLGLRLISLRSQGNGYGGSLEKVLAFDIRLF